MFPLTNVFKPAFKDKSGKQVHVGSFVLNGGDVHRVRDYNQKTDRYQDELTRKWYSCLHPWSIQLADDMLADSWVAEYDRKCREQWEHVDNKSWKAIRQIYISYIDDVSGEVRYRIFPVKSSSGAFGQKVFNQAIQGIPGHDVLVLSNRHVPVRLDQSTVSDVWLATDKILLYNPRHTALADPAVVGTPGDVTFKENGPGQYQVVKPDGSLSMVIGRGLTIDWYSIFVSQLFDKLKAARQPVGSSPRRRLYL